VPPTGDIEAVMTAHRLVLADVERLGDGDVRAPSRLPDWSRGHVLSHLARHADSHAWLFAGARAGEVRRQYPGKEVRAADIEAGAGRPADELRRDYRDSFERLEASWSELPDASWSREGLVSTGTSTMTDLVFRRLREVEVHHVDLDVGYTEADWSPTYVEGELTRRLRALPDRADHRAIVAWLLGRAGAPELGPW
jgi:maleylpyruvate isomerase